MQIIVSQSVLKHLSTVLQNRAAIIDVFYTIRDELDANYDEIKDDRDPYDPDYFFFSLAYLSNHRLHYFDFAVTDTRKPGYLYVDAVS